MKTMESSSWNKKWHLKEGNIVNDNKELSLNPTTKNNLNADLEFSESPTQENPQNLIRHRRSNGNNQPQNTFVPVDVPGDGSCLFWATALAYLIPVEDNSVIFAERFKRLFGAKESENIRHIRELIRKYDPFSDNIRSDRTFNRLVTRVLRDRVVDYISLRENGYREFITGDFNQYLNNMRNRNTWGGEPEIVAMGRMLGATINVDADGAVHTRGSGNIPIRLYHVNAARSASQGNERNHYNFGLERNLHQQITNEVVPELVDHLFQIDENNNFKQRFQSFLDQIPRPSGVGAAPAKKGFYVNFFAGMFTTLKNTELFDRLGLAELHFKLCTISDADEVPFLKIVAITEEPTTKKLEEYVFVISEKRYSRQIMGAIFSRDDRRWLEESSFLFSEGDDSYHLRSRAHTRIGEIEFKSGAAIIISNRNNRDRVNVRAEQLTDQELPEGMRVKFRRIEQHRKHKIGEYKSNLLEDIVKNLSRETVDNPNEDIKIVQAMQSNVKKLFEYIYDINRKYHTRLPNIQGALEAADHGFTAGALINFKYRYNLELYLELLLGIEGYIDIALLVRGSQRVKKAMPILMEIKTGQEQNGRTNPQQALREAESYTQGLQQNNRPFVTLADRVVRVGFNMDYANPIEISMAELQPPAPIIRTIFESINNGDADVIRTTITNQLKKIYKLSPGVQGSSEPQYLSRLFIGHSILNSVDTRGKRIDKHVLTYRKLQDTTRGTRRSHDITTSVFIERTITGSNTGDNRVLVIHFHEGGRSNVDINDPTLRVPLNGIINQANCKEVIEVYVDARSGNDGSLKFLTEDNGIIIQDFTNSVNDYFQANVVNHWEIHNMPDFNQAGNLKKTLDATVSYQPQRGQNNKVDLGPYGDMFTNIGKNLFSVKFLITSEAYFAAVLSGLLNSYSDIEFDQGDFKINVRPEFQVGGGERIDLFINVMSKNHADSDVLIGLELKYGDGRATVDSMDRTLEKAEKVQLRRYGISRNIRAITEGANFFVTLPVGFVSSAEDSDSLVITRKQFVAYDIERSFGQVHQLGRNVQQNEQTLASATLQQNPDYRYWLSDQDIRRIAHLDNTYSNMFDVHAMNNNYDTSGRGLVVVTDRDQGINTGELREQIRQFIDNVDNNRIAQQQGVPRRTFIVNQGGDHWTTLVIAQQNGQYHGYYVDSLGSGVPDNIRQILTDNNIINPIDFQIRQQADGYNCGLWALENARDVNTMLQENRDVVWLRKQLDPERLGRSNAQYFIDRRRAFSQVLHHNQPNGISAQLSLSSQREYLESLEEARSEIGLRPSGNSCDSSSSSNKRRKRDICSKDEGDEQFPYEPLQENIEQSVKTNARLYSDVAYLFSLQHFYDVPENIKVDNVLQYNINIANIINEGEINHSNREEEVLENHYIDAEEFISQYPKDILLDLVESKAIQTSSYLLLDNGQNSLVVSHGNNYYKVYSQDYNYRVVFKTKDGVNFNEIKQFTKAFFLWRSGSAHYQIFTLSKNIPQGAIDELKKAKFWSPDLVASDLTLLNEGSLRDISGIPAKVVRELFFLDGKVPELNTLHESFFHENSGKVSLRMEEVHNILPSLSKSESVNLVNLIKVYNFPVDTHYLNTIPESNKDLLQAYHNKVNDKLKQSNAITIEDLSALSWEIIENKMSEHPDISYDLKEAALKNVKDLHSSTSARMHALGITTQTLFFLPDIIRSVNNDAYGQLAKLGGMVGGDMVLNKLYESLINKLEPVLSSSRIALLKNLPVTSPIFKVLTIHSIIELTSELNSLPANSEKREISKHLLGEQYVTLGLIVAETFGFATGPLWIVLMTEQLIYSAIALRKEYHLDISFNEALLMSLGFEKNKLQSILEEKGLADVNLSLINTLSNQTQISYDFAVVKVPKILDDLPYAASSVIEFKPVNHHFCMEDNVFLRDSSGYNRISSVTDSNSQNCATKSSLHITGEGLAALYSNQELSKSTRNIVNIFDPNEGDLTLKFTKEGLQELDRINSKSQYNATNPYVVNTKILHKPYPDRVGLLGNKNHSFVLNDDSKRIISKYYIDGTIPFNINDNTISTSIVFLNNKLVDGYNSYIKGNTSNILIDSIYPGEGTISNIALTNQNYLRLDIKFTVIKELNIDIAHTDLLYARGKSPRNLGRIEIKSNVLNSTMVLGPNIKLLINKYGNVGNKRIFALTTHESFSGNLPLVFVQFINGYKPHLIFNIDNLQSILNNMNQVSSSFPSKFYFECVQPIESSTKSKQLCNLSNTNILNNIILIQGQLNGLNAKLAINAQSSTLEVLQNQNVPKHIEYLHYNNRAMLENNLLSFKKVINPDNYSASYYHSNIRKHRMSNKWLMLEFSSNSKDKILHHFKYDYSNNNKLQINRINYKVVKNRIYAVLDSHIDSKQLIKFDDTRTVSVLVDKVFKNSTVLIQENKININNITVNNLPNKTIIIFQEGANKSLSVSVKLLKDSFSLTRNKRQADQELQMIYSAQSMSSSASRLEFGPISIIKNIYAKVISSLNYCSSSFFGKKVQSSPDTYYDTLGLDRNAQSYLSDVSDMGSQNSYEIPNNNYEHSTPPSSSTENQEVNCVPYVWDANSQEYNTDAMSCILPYGHAKIFSNIHQGSNSIQEKGYSIKGDHYKNCRSVEFYGRPSAYCEGDHTNLVYTQNIPPSLDQINAQLMLARVFRIDKLIGKLVTRAKVLLGLEETHVAKEENTSLNPEIVEITSQQQNEWQISIKNIESLLKTLSSGVSDNNIRWAKNIFEDRIEEIEKLNKQSAANTEIMTALNENLKVLQTDLEESIECICDTGCQRQELQQVEYNSRYSAHAHLVHCMSALHVDNNIGYCSTTNLNHVIDQYPQIVSNYT